MVLDGHIHMMRADGDAAATQKKLLADMKAAGVDGGMILSPDPHTPGTTAQQRLAAVMALCQGAEHLYPAYWVNPLEEDAVGQVDAAVAAGVDAFKIICSGYYPSDDRAMEIYRRIAGHGKPILFHSGILWDGRASSKYNRPGEFECLLEVPDLRFSLAHVSWPWCDECIAVYGKFNNAFVYRPDLSCEMFIDVTPGTPPLWREEVYKKLFCGDYDVLHNVVFGTDSSAEGYSVKWTQDWMARDNGLYGQFGLTADPAFLPHIYAENLLRFLGKSDEVFEKKIPQVAQEA